MAGSYEEFDDRHLDALCELGNIGAGNAATSLSVMVGDTVRVGAPKATVLDYDEAIRAIGDPEGTVATVMVRFEGDVRGVVLFILGCGDAKDMADMLAEGLDSGGGPGAFSDMQLSALKEAGNILASSYLGALTALTGLRIGVSAPQISVDMAGAAMGAAMSEFSAGHSRILMVGASLVAEARRLGSHMALFADVRSLNRILDRAGAG